jgi:hypothetical protein
MLNVRKFLKDNSRAAIFVLMALLLISFLLGDVIQWFGSNQEFRNVLGEAKAFGVKYTNADHAAVDNVMRFGDLVGASFRDQRGNPVMEPLDFFLLEQEAHRMGIHIGPEQALQRLQMVRGDNAARDLAEVTRMLRTSQSSVLEMLARAMTVQAAGGLSVTAYSDSLPRMQTEYRDRTQAAKLRVSAIDSSVLIAKAPEPSDQEVQAFFDQYRDVEPGGRSTTEMKFGYRQPNRVRIEYLTVSPTALKNVRVRQAEAERYFEQNKNRYMRTVMPEGGDGGQPHQVPMTFEEAEAQVREDLRQEKAAEEARRIIDQMREEAMRPWASQPLEDSGFRRTPEKIVTLASLKEKYAAKYPLQYEVTGLVSSQELTMLVRPQPTYMSGTEFLTLPMYAMRVPGLYEPPKTGAGEVLALHEPSQVMVAQTFSPTGRTMFQPYVFAVLEATPAGPPADVSVVSAQIRMDLKKKHAFETAGAEARKLAERARQVGLDEAVKEAADLRALLGEVAIDPANPESALPPEVDRALKQLIPTTPSGTFTRTRPTILGIGTLSGQADEVFALSEQPGEHKVGAFPMADAEKWVVIELQGVDPIYQGSFEQEMNGMGDFSVRQQILMDWRGKIRERAGWTPANPERGA